MGNKIIEIKSYNFAIEIVNTCKEIMQNKKEFVLSKQLLRSGTSIGANVEEAQGGYSRKEFEAKLQIAFKETLETIYWIRILRDTSYLDEQLATNLLNKCIEIKRILSSIRLSLQKSRR